MWGTFWMNGKDLEILSCFLGCISPQNFYLAVTGEIFWWIVCDNMKITLFCRFDYLMRFTHFREHFWPAVLDWGMPLHFSQLWYLGLNKCCAFYQLFLMYFAIFTCRAVGCFMLLLCRVRCYIVWKLSRFTCFCVKLISLQISRFLCPLSCLLCCWGLGDNKGGQGPSLVGALNSTALNNAPLKHV